MILQRVARDFREQNWISVFLELFVVVVGIFLGLRADAWNEARRDRIRERVHLEQIYAELGTDVDELKDLSDSQSEIASNLMFAIGIVKRGKIAPDEVDRFKWAIMLAVRYPPATIQRAGYDTLIASGDFSILQDPDLRTRLVRLYSDFDGMPKRLEALIGNRSSDSPYSAEVVYAVPHPSGKGVLWKVDFESVKDNPATLGYLANQRRNHTLIGRMYADAASRAAELREYIGDLTGQEDASDHN